MSLKGYIARRAIYTVILLFAIIIFNFVLFQVLPFLTACPSGISYTECAVALYVPPPAKPGAPNQTAVYEHQRQEVIKAYGFNESLPTRFVLYIRNMLTWNFGLNIGGALAGLVATTIQIRLPYTLALLGLSTIAAFIIGIGLGVVASAKRGKVVDVSALAGALFFNALPTFWLGGILIVLQIILTGGAYVNVGTAVLGKAGLEAFAAMLQALWLPFLTLTLVSLGAVFLTMRATMIDVLAEDYIVVARAKGIQERSVLFRYAFRNAVIPIVTLFALSIGFILAGAVVTETVFNWPGLGSAIYRGVVSNDFPLEQAIFYIIALMVLLANFVVDVLYGYLDPRIKTG